MRTLNEIINAVKFGEHPDYEELYYTVVALDILHTMALKGMYDLATKSYDDDIKALKVETMHNTVRTAVSKLPKEWLGTSFDPKTEEYQRQRNISLKIAERFLKND